MVAIAVPSSKTLARALGTHAVGYVVELAREFLHEQIMIPARAVASNEVLAREKACVSAASSPTRIVMAGWKGQAAVARVVNRALRIANFWSSAPAIDIIASFEVGRRSKATRTRFSAYRSNESRLPGCVPTGAPEIFAGAPANRHVRRPKPSIVGRRPSRLVDGCGG